MTRSLDARIRALSRTIGWSLTVLKDSRGRVVQVHTLTLLDAFLRVQLYGGELGLDPDLTAFLSTYIPKQSEGAMVATLRYAARRIRFPNEPDEDEVVANLLLGKSDEVLPQTVDKSRRSPVPRHDGGSPEKTAQRPSQNVSDGVSTGADNTGVGIVGEASVGVPVAGTRSTRSRVDALGRRSI